MRYVMLAEMAREKYHQPLQETIKTGLLTIRQSFMRTLYNKAKNDRWEESEVVMAIIARFGTGGGNIPILVEDESDLCNTRGRWTGCDDDA